MTARDLAWRGSGLALSVGGCAVSLLDRGGSPLTVLYFLVTIAGIVLMLNGKRVAVAVKAERRGHCDTAAAIHAGRIRRRLNCPRR
jgi:hypothetical protein